MATIEQAFHLAIEHHRAGRVADAENLYRQILQFAPRHAGSLNLLGVIEIQRRQPETGVELIGQAIAIDPNQSSFHSNLGEAYRAVGQLAKARQCFEHALRLGGNITETHNNLGLILQSQGDLPAAQQCYERAIALRPDNAEAHYNLSRLLLLEGDFEAGWREHAWRRRIFGHPSQTLTTPVWDGKPLENRTLLLYGEQGLGDNLQFIRFVPLVKSRVANLVVQVPDGLLPLLSCSGIQHLAPLTGPTPPHGVQCSLADLPEHFGTTIETIPARVPYLFPAEYLLAAWRTEMKQHPGFRVGIAWQGNPDFYSDRWRSIPLTDFEPLTRVPEVRLVSLQKHDGAKQLDAIAGRLKVVRFDDRLDIAHGSFMDTAALMKCLDLVVTSDTSIAHLAGALGVPTWVVLPQAPDWRWMLHRQDSPWYPTMRLFRQAQAGSWTEVMHRVAEALTERSRSHSST